MRVDSSIKGMVAGKVGNRRSMTSPTRTMVSGSTLYSRITWNPRRATFSVSIDRRSSITVTPWAAMQPTNKPGSRLRSWVNSSVKIIDVNGERMVPPIIAAMPIAAQSPPSPKGNHRCYGGAERAAHHQEWCQHAARGAGAEGDGPDQRFADHQSNQS